MPSAAVVHFWLTSSDWPLSDPRIALLATASPDAALGTTAPAGVVRARGRGATTGHAKRNAATRDRNRGNASLGDNRE